MDQVKRIVRLGIEDKEFEDAEDGIFCCLFLHTEYFTCLFLLMALYCRLDPRYVYPLLDKFAVQLMSPFSWEIIPNTR